MSGRAVSSASCHLHRAHHIERASICTGQRFCRQSSNINVTDLYASEQRKACPTRTNRGGRVTHSIPNRRIHRGVRPAKNIARCAYRRNENDRFSSSKRVMPGGCDSCFVDIDANKSTSQARQSLLIMCLLDQA